MLYYSRSITLSTSNKKTFFGLVRGGSRGLLEGPGGPQNPDGWPWGPPGAPGARLQKVENPYVSQGPCPDFGVLAEFIVLVAPKRAGSPVPSPRYTVTKGVS